MIRKMTNGMMDTMMDHYMNRMMQDPIHREPIFFCHHYAETNTESDY
jgi:hypothetical protein